MRITFSAEERGLLTKAIGFARLSASFEGPGEYGRYSRPLNIGVLADLEHLLEAEQSHLGARTFVLTEELASAAQTALFFAAQQVARFADEPGSIHPVRAQLIAQRFAGKPLHQVSEQLTGLAARLAARHRKMRPTVPPAVYTDDSRMALGGGRHPSGR